MPPINVLIKPASSSCNMNCKYCFYNAVCENRSVANTGLMSIDLLEQLVKETITYADRFCGFVFQGGEPTLIGLDFFDKCVQFQKKYNVQDITIANSIQTNGTLIDDNWCRFFAEHNFLVGLSLDGPAEIHDMNRKTTGGQGTFHRVMKTARMLEKSKVEFNILSVVTGHSARKIEKVYNFFKKNRFRYLQFIPCIDPLEMERGSMNYSLNMEDYSSFLCRLFDLWFEDYKKGNYISIRQLDNFVRMMTGKPPEVCNMQGTCSLQLVVESNGNVYPCDFYAYDQWLMGTIGEQTLKEMTQSDIALKFLEESIKLPQSCQECRFLGLCRNGCKRDRLSKVDGEMQTVYCQSNQKFFEHALLSLQGVANMTYRYRAEANDSL